VGIESTIREWMADSRGSQVLRPIYEQIGTKTRKIFRGAGRNDDEKTGEENEFGLDIMDTIKE
jgi:hypothetical protein